MKVFSFIKVMRSSLKNKLALGMALIFSLALVSMFFFINAKVEEIIHNHVVTVALQDARCYTRKIDNWFNAATQRVEDLARFLEVLPDAKLLPDIVQSLVEIDEIDNAFIGFSDGSSVNGLGWVPPIDWRATEAPWYDPVVAGGGEVVITAPYISASTEALSVSIAIYMEDLDGLSAVVGIQILLEFLSDLIDYYSNVGEGYLILVGSDDYVIIHPKGFSPNEKGEFYHLCDVPGGNFYRELLSTRADIMEFEESSIGPAYVIRSNLESVDWTLISVMPMENIQELVNQYTSSIMSIVAVVLVILFSVIAFFMTRLKLVSAKALEANQAKTAFFSNMSHEIRTPMNAILGMTAIGKKSHDVDVKDYSLVRIEEASTHLLGLINDVLDMSKIEAGKLELYNGEFEFEDAIQKAASIMEGAVIQKSQQLSVFVDSEIPKRIIADEQKLMQVLTNLLSNAVKFTPPHGTIHLGAYLVQEEAGLYTIKIEVKDTGVGISAELLPKLFDSYERADNDICRKVGGTGLGLAITKRIVELFQGDIWAESEIGKGTTLTFTIKVAGMREIKPKQSQPVEPIVQEEVSETSLKGYKLLLVEDIEINREILMALLEETEVEIDCAENGVEAVEKFMATPLEYDLIFMDLHMPEMDGITATRTLRASGAPHAKTVPIIAMTADVFQTAIDECFEAGMNDYISKPLNTAVIIEKLNHYLK